MVGPFHGGNAVELHESHALDQRQQPLSAKLPPGRFAKSLEVEKQATRGPGIE